MDSVQTMEVEATVTKRGQTTMPSAIRKVLKVTASEARIVYRVLADGSVVLSKKEGPGDPVIGEFLEFLVNDTRNNLSSLRPLTPEWFSGLQKMVEGVELDMNAPLAAEDE